MTLILRTMKRIVTGLFLTVTAAVCAAGSANAQSVSTEKQVAVSEAADQTSPVSFVTVEQKAVFPGGEAELMKFIAQNLVYPADAADAQIGGKVVVSFVIEKDGSVSNVKVVKSVYPSLDAEAVRVVRKLPRWTPGRNNGAPVRVVYTLPISFKLH
ncbi:MAG: energy transducer TonB [Muribaculaceae bacterium]|nr:energy transducer TonB [Muribaculaceae bacterium]